MEASSICILSTLALILTGQAAEVFYPPPRTFAYIPVDADVDMLLGLSVDAYIIYARSPNLPEGRELAHALANRLKTSGKEVYVVVGNMITDWDAGEIRELVRNDVAYFADSVDGIVLWDDPIRGGNIPVRNNVSQWVRENWRQLTDGRNLSLGLALDPPYKVESYNPGFYANLDLLDFGPYDFVVTYYYCQANLSKYFDQLNRSLCPFLVAAQGIDPGESGRLSNWTTKMTEISADWDLPVWFTLAAHTEQSLTTVPSQMTLDLLHVKGVGFAAIGWYTIAEYSGTVKFVGQGKGPYDWVTFNYLKWVLLEFVEKPTSRELQAAIADLQTLVVNQSLRFSMALGDLLALHENMRAWMEDLQILADGNSNNLSRLMNSTEVFRDSVDQALSSSRNQVDVLDGKLVDLEQHLDDLEEQLPQATEEIQVLRDRIKSGELQIRLLGLALVAVAVATLSVWVKRR